MKAKRKPTTPKRAGVAANRVTKSTKTAAVKRAKPSSRPRAKRKSTKSDVEAYFDTLKHELKPAMLALRDTIRGVDSRIDEEIKWSAPSFKLDDHFATFHLRGNMLLVVLHRGARSIAPPRRPPIPDPYRILEWRGTDRAIINFSSVGAAMSRLGAVRSVIVSWLESLRDPPTAT